MSDDLHCLLVLFHSQVESQGGGERVLVQVGVHLLALIEVLDVVRGGREGDVVVVYRRLVHPQPDVGRPLIVLGSLPGRLVPAENSEHDL